MLNVVAKDCSFPYAQAEGCALRVPHHVNPMKFKFKGNFNLVGQYEFISLTLLGKRQFGM